MFLEGEIFTRDSPKGFLLKVNQEDAALIFMCETVWKVRDAGAKLKEEMNI